MRKSESVVNEVTKMNKNLDQLSKKMEPTEMTVTTLKEKVEFRAKDRERTSAPKYNLA